MQRRLRYNEDRSFKLLHLCYYFSKPEFKNDDVKRIIDFKNQDEQAIRYFTIQALENLQYHQIDQDLFIIRALHSYETDADSVLDPLDRLGDGIGTVFDCSYYSRVLSKTRVTKAIKSFTIAQRKAELEGVYKLDANMFNFNNRKILIIDDVITTGTTACAIIKAILDEFPLAEIEVFGLAWTPTFNQQNYLVQQQSCTQLNEPDLPYGGPLEKKWHDEDFENGETNISINP